MASSHRTTTRVLLVAACAAAALALAGQAGAGTTFGVADNHPFYMADRGVKFFAAMNDVGLTEDRLSILWDPAEPATIPGKEALDQTMAQAKLHGIDIILAVYPEKPTALNTAAAVNEFVTFLQIVAAAYPDVHTIAVGNEPNQPRFFQPQFGPNCSPASGVAYARLLAQAYDALKSVDQSISVLSSLSPRGNDDCHASSNISTSPVKFIHDMGAAYAALHRTRPIFDQFGINLYPNQSTDPLLKGYQWPKVGVSNLDRLKQALWDAFHGTAQPTPGIASSYRFGHSVNTLISVPITISEIGWQVKVDAAHASAYYGKESVTTTTEQGQAQVYSQLLRYVSCDPTVKTMMFFGLVDEPNLDRFQAALIRADWTLRPSYDAVKQTIAQLNGDCPGKETQWKPTTTVVGVGASFPQPKAQWWKQSYWGFTATAKEDSTFTAGLFRVPGSGPSDSFASSVRSALSGPDRAPAKTKPVLSRTGIIKANWSPLIRFAPKRLKAGRYVYAITIRALMDPARTAFFQSKPFTVLPKKTKHHH